MSILIDFVEGYMYVREAKNREEVWLLDHIEEFGLDETAFRSRDYVVAVDETSREKAGFGRIRLHPGEEEHCELTSIGVLPEWRGQGVGAHVIERLIDHADDQDFETVYALTSEVDYLRQFGFEPIEASELPPPLRTRLEEIREDDAEAIGLAIEVESFTMPDRLREAFKTASKSAAGEREEATADEANAAAEPAEDFGIDAEDATYKYDVDG